MSPHLRKVFSNMCQSPSCSFSQSLPRTMAPLIRAAAAENGFWWVNRMRCKPRSVSHSIRERWIVCCALSSPHTRSTSSEGGMSLRQTECWDDDSFHLSAFGALTSRSVSESDTDLRENVLVVDCHHNVHRNYKVISYIMECAPIVSPKGQKSQEPEHHFTLGNTCPVKIYNICSGGAWKTKKWRRNH